MQPAVAYIRVCCPVTHKVPFIDTELWLDVDPFMLLIHAAVAAEKERTRIAQRTRGALATAKASGPQLRSGDLPAQSYGSPRILPGACARS